MPLVLRHQLHPLLAYAAAVAISALAALLSHQLSPAGLPYVPLVIFAAAVAVSAAIGGRGPALLAAVAAVLVVDYFFIPLAGAWKPPYMVAQMAAFGAFTVAAVLMAWTAHVARTAETEKARADALAARFVRTARLRESLLELGGRALAGGSVDALAREATAMTVDVLGVEHCAIFELTRDGGPLIISAARGWEAQTIEGLTIDADVDTQPGYALHAREPVIVSDADVETRFTIPAVLRARGLRSGVAARIMGAGRPFGVIAAYSTSPRQYAAEDAQFVCGAASVLAGMYERKRLDGERAELAARDTANRSAAELAAKRAAFLAQTVTVFDAALEPEATLVSLARLAVPTLAECAIVDLVHEDGHVRRVEVVDIDPVRRDVTQALRRQAPTVRGESPFSRAIRTGQPVLLSEVPDREPLAGADPEHERLMKMLECKSLLLVPLVARGQTLGLLTLASRGRQYDAADLGVGQELAGRAAIALDNARLYREAQAASRAKDDFLATISHELRTPINAVLGWAAMLREHRLDQSRAEYACDAIERSARAQAQLLEQLLDVSRAISGKLELHLAPTNLGGIVEGSVDAVRPDADDKKVRIASRIDRGVPLMMVDPERLQQVVINVVTNAVKFSPEDGLVQVELRRDSGFAEIVVQDQGVGIKREFLPYVFERFRQAGSREGANRGLGLGMSIARDIVERHGGTITAESEGEGKGATFTVRLPLRSAADSSVLAGRRTSPADTGATHLSHG